MLFICFYKKAEIDKIRNTEEIVKMKTDLDKNKNSEKKPNEKRAHKACRCQNGSVLIICNVYICCSVLFLISGLKISKEL